MKSFWSTWSHKCPDGFHHLAMFENKLSTKSIPEQVYHHFRYHFHNFQLPWGLPLCENPWIFSNKSEFSSSGMRHFSHLKVHHGHTHVVGVGDHLHLQSEKLASPAGAPKEWSKPTWVSNLNEFNHLRKTPNSIKASKKIEIMRFMATTGTPVQLLQLNSSKHGDHPASK